MACDALRAHECAPCVQRKVRRVFSRYGYCEEFAYVVMGERNQTHRPLAILAIDRGVVNLAWGSMRAITESLPWSPFFGDDDGNYDDTQRCLVFSSSFQVVSSATKTAVKVDPCTFVFSCTGNMRTPNAFLPGHKQCPCNRCHVLVKEVPSELWRSRPHVIVQAAVCMHDDKEPLRWQRCALTSDLRFEPPLVSWSGSYVCRQDRTLCVRLAPMRNLMAPRLVRINKLVCLRMAVAFGTHCRLEVIQQVVGSAYTNRYPREIMALDDLARNVAATSHASARTIQRAWRESVSNPAFSVCRRRLLRELLSF